MSKKTNKRFRFTSSLSKVMEQYLEKLKKETESSKLLYSKLFIFDNKSAFDRVKNYLTNSSTFSFNRLIYLDNLKDELLSYIRAEEGTNSNLMLSNIGKKILLTQIAEDLKIDKKKGSYIKKLINLTKFIADISKFITELKSIYHKNFYDNKNKIFNVDKLENIVFSQIVNENTKNKYMDIAEIFRRYENTKNELNLIDKEDIIIQTIDYLNSNKKIKLSNLSNIEKIIIPAMFTISTFDIDLLSAFSSNLSCELDITLFDCETNQYLRDYLKNTNFIEETSLTNLNQLSSLTKISIGLFNENSLDIDNFIENDFSALPEKLKFINNTTYEAEIITIAKLIKEKLRNDENLNLDEIMLIVPNLNNYKTYLKYIFKKLGIDIFISEGENLSNPKLIYTLLNILELKLYGFRYSDFIKLIKSNYVFIREKGKYTKNYAVIIENFFKERRIDEKYFDRQIENYIKNKRENSEFNNNKYLNELEEALSHVKKVKKILYPNNERSYKLPNPNEKHTFYDITKAYRKIIEDDLSILRNVFMSKERLKDRTYFTEEELEISKKDSIVFGKFLDLLEEIGYYLNMFHVKQNLREFYSLLKQSLSEIKYYEDTYSKNKIQIYNIEDVQYINFKHIFICGMIENSFPRKYPTDIFITNKEKGLLNYISSTKLLKTKEEFYKKEEDLFKCILESPTQKIYLSTINENEDGKSTLTSFFIDEIVEILKNLELHKYPNLEEKELKANLTKYNTKSPNKIYFKQELIEKILNNNKNDILNLGNSKTNELILNFKQKINKISETINVNINIEQDYLSRLLEIIFIENIRNNKYHYTNYDGNLLFSENKTESKIIEYFFQLNYNSVSPTSFEDFGKCPMRFFINKVLGIKDPKGIDDILTPLDKGTIIHRALELFYKDYIKDKKLELLSEETLKKQLTEYIKREFALLNEDNKISNYTIFKLNQLENIIKKVNRFFEKDFELLKTQSYNPSYFEYSFGNKKDMNTPLKINDKDNNFIIEVGGSIDRIDLSSKTENDAVQNVRVIDYKTSKNKKSQAQIEKATHEGIMFQPVLYSLKVIDDKNFEPEEIDWIYYYIFNIPTNIITKKGLKVPYFRLNKNSFLVKKTINYIIEYKGKILKGLFALAPKECSSYCGFRDVCRYTKYLTEEKREQSNYWEDYQYLQQ